MDNLLEALAKGMNVSIDGISELLGSIKDNTPQLYEQLVKEWTYYQVLGKLPGAMYILIGVFVVIYLCVRYNLEVDDDYINMSDVPNNMSRCAYAKLLTQENIKKASSKFKKIYVGMFLSLALGLVFDVAKYIVSPNYSFFLNEILPKLSQK